MGCVRRLSDESRFQRRRKNSVRTYPKRPRRAATAAVPAETQTSCRSNGGERSTAVVATSSRCLNSLPLRGFPRSTSPKPSTTRYNPVQPGRPILHGPVPTDRTRSKMKDNRIDVDQSVVQPNPVRIVFIVAAIVLWCLDVDFKKARKNRKKRRNLKETKREHVLRESRLKFVPFLCV